MELCFKSTFKQAQQNSAFSQQNTAVRWNSSNSAKFQENAGCTILLWANSVGQKIRRDMDFSLHIGHFYRNPKLLRNDQYETPSTI